MKPNWKTTVIGALAAGLQTLEALSNWDALSPKQIAFKFGLAAFAFAFGLWAHDPK
jgi:hypothetical protein